ncbi:MAG: 3-deoxy-D-manno-octulosonic acid transferase [Bacteroidales bacterium]
MYFAYTLLILALFAVCSPYFVYQAIRYRKYTRTIRQRLGFLPVSLNVDAERSIWIQAVSVGEALAARPLAAELKQRYPHLRLFISTTTIAGQQVARQNVKHVDGVFYFPFDLGFSVKRTLRILKPRLFVMMETEIWPRLLHECRRAGVKTMLVNGRISARSYPRYRLVRPLLGRVLGNVDRFCVQNDQSRERLLHLGADTSRIAVTGSLKFDALQVRGGDDRVLRFFPMSENRPVIIAGSTMKGEEAAVLEAFGHVRVNATRALLVIAPRHPERFGEVQALSVEAGFKTVRRSELPIDEEPRADVVILDTIGELAQLYQVATVVFVGGSLVDTGGHNILEPAIFGKPIVFGPYMQNFAEIREAFLESRAAVEVRDAAELEMTLRQLLTDGDERVRLGTAARRIVEANRGATDKTIAVLTALLPPAEMLRPGTRRLRVVR